MHTPHILNKISLFLRLRVQNSAVAAAFMLAISADVAAGTSLYGGIALGGTFPTRNTVTYLPGNSYAGILGYQPNKYLALETGVAYTDWKIYSDNNSRNTQIASASLLSTSLSAIGYIPVSDSWRVFGKLGTVNGLYTLISCTTCTGGESYAGSNSLIWGSGVSFHTTNANQPLFRLGFERYEADTQLSPKLSVDHVYLLMSLGI